ncbi:MAG: deaminase [Acidobacteria bacterium]|nr:deaminase [Acidobacteriota bacterium]
MATPVGPYTPVMRSGDLLFSSGQIGIVDGSLVDGGFEAELSQALENLSEVLAQEGATLDDVIKTTVFVLDMERYGAMNDIYLRAFGDHRPARSAVAVAALPLGALVEIEAIARASTT